MKAKVCAFDPNSFANTDEVITKHSHLQLSVDFDRRTVKGRVSHTLQGVSLNGAQLVTLDTSHLTVTQVYEGQTELQFAVEQRDALFGSPLTIILPQMLKLDQTITVTIVFETTQHCTALQWLEPTQTAGRQLPYVFTQCQAIHARSLLPCQDTPSVKITYSAELTVPVAFQAVMSAIRTNESISAGSKICSFRQATAIPSYLIAFAVGNLVGKKVGPRTTVWSEPEIIDAAAAEFDDTERFVAAGEALLTPYEWGVYDLLVLPASFPYGGMENPCLTFVTPTLLAGDKSLVDVIIHEISHSWMGNLVTTKNWEHFWLNEGFTVFVERKIVGILHGGTAARDFSAIIGLKSLKESVEHFEEINKPQYSCLCPKLLGVDPDDVFSSVPYEKGSNLLVYLENILGGPSVFDPYLKAHVKTFAHKSITTSDFKDFLYQFFDSKRAILDTVDWDSWFFKPGMPIVQNVFDRSMAVEAEKLAQDWDAARNQKNPGFTKELFDSFSSNQKVVFLDFLLLKPPLPIHTLDSMNATYELAGVKNCEVRFRWQWLCLKSDYEQFYPQVTEFISSVGRMKYVRPLYRALANAKNGKELAKTTFIEHRSFYHPICASMVSKDLGISS